MQITIKTIKMENKTLLIHEIFLMEMKEKGLSKKQVVQLSGVPQTTVYQFLRGKRENLGISKYEKILNAIRKYEKN